MHVVSLTHCDEYFYNYNINTYLQHWWKYMYMIHHETLYIQHCTRGVNAHSVFELSSTAVKFLFLPAHTVYSLYALGLLAVLGL